MNPRFQFGNAAESGCYRITESGYPGRYFNLPDHGYRR